MDTIRIITILAAILFIVFWIAVIAVSAYFISLIIRALRKYVNSKEVREEKIVILKSLGELLKENRLRFQIYME